MARIGRTRSQSPRVVDLTLPTGPARLTLPAPMTDADWLALFLLLPRIRAELKAEQAPRSQLEIPVPRIPTS